LAKWRGNLERLGYGNVSTKIGDGYQGSGRRRQKLGPAQLRIQTIRGLFCGAANSDVIFLILKKVLSLRWAAVGADRKNAGEDAAA
jgi:hypothetical protein